MPASPQSLRGSNGPGWARSLIERISRFRLTPKEGWLVAVLCAGLLGGCSNNQTGDRAQSSPSPSSGAPSLRSSELECPEQAEVLDRAATTALQGDVDGDGAVDRVFLLEEAGGCPPTLIVQAGGTTHSVQIEEEASGPGLPNLAFLADIDGRSGSEPIVRMAAGASTEFFGAFALLDGSLRRLEVEGSTFGDLFPSGGSAGHLDATDCAAKDRLVVATALPQGDGYEVERRFYRASGATFGRVGATRSVVEPDELSELQVFSASPFGSCPSA